MQAMFKLGFDTKPDIELREKGRPLLPTYWARTTTMTTAYGHGIAVTPLHLASAYAALVNGGIWRPATLLKVAPGHAPEGRRVLSEATSARMRQMLRLVVMRGTGARAMRRAIASGARLVRPRRRWRAAMTDAQRGDVCGGLPDGCAALCCAGDARLAKGTKDVRVEDRSLERRAGGRADDHAVGAMLGVARRQQGCDCRTCRPVAGPQGAARGWTMRRAA
jgi:hypothetical protein